MSQSLWQTFQQRQNLLLLMQGVWPHAKGLSRTQQHSQENTGPKKFEDYTYTYSGPDVQSHLQMNQANSHMATPYDQALGAIKYSLNTANPLASLNL